MLGDLASKKDVIFTDLTAENDIPTTVESLCVNCGENGETKLLLTKIPHYKEVVLTSFTCDHCGFQNNDIQSNGKIQEQGVTYKVRVHSPRDLNRQVVKSLHATIKVPEIDLDIPASADKGAISTIEGVLRRTLSGLLQDQTVNRTVDEEKVMKLEKVIAKIEDLMTCKQQFHIILDDPSGNSFIENPHAPRSDPDRTVTHYYRTKAQDNSVGFYLPVSEMADEADPKRPNRSEILEFPTSCPECNAPANTHMKVRDVPDFKEVILTLTICEYCGNKMNEVKSEDVEPRGIRITLNVTNPQTDLEREVVKSDSCSVTIPELSGFSPPSGGLLSTLRELLRIAQLEERPAERERKDSTIVNMKSFNEKLNEMIEGKKNFTFIMNDPTGNSYMQNVYAPDKDPELTIEEFDRSWDQNEALGLNDLKVEGYEEEHLMETGQLRHQLLVPPPTSNGSKRASKDDSASAALLASTSRKSVQINSPRLSSKSVTSTTEPSTQ